MTLKDGGYSRDPNGEELGRTKVTYERENSVDSVESLDSRAFQPISEGSFTFFSFFICLDKV